MSIHKPQDPPSSDPQDLPLDYWIVENDTLNNHYYCNNNIIKFDCC